MTNRRSWPTRYRAGPYSIVELALRRGFAVVTATGRSAVTVTHPNTGRPVARTMTLPEALRTLRALAADL